MESFITHHAIVPGRKYASIRQTNELIQTFGKRDSAA